MTMLDEFSVLVILPSSPDPRSNGIQSYLSLVDNLKNLRGVVYTSGPMGKDHYSTHMPGYYIQEDILINKIGLIANVSLVVLPDHIDGLGSKIYDIARCTCSDSTKFINVVLAPIFVFADRSLRSMEVTYDCRDYFVYFNKLFAPTYLCAKDVYQEPSFDYLFDSDSFSLLGAASQQLGHSSDDVLVYAGKGHYCVSAEAEGELRTIKDYLDSSQIDTKLITRLWPSSKQEYTALLAKAAGLILLDPFTNLVRDALMLGVPVFSAVTGIDYNSYGIAKTADSFLTLISKRSQIAKSAWDRHYSLARFNIMKQSIFFQAVHKMLDSCDSTVPSSLRNIVIPFTPEFYNSSLELASELRRYCVVGNLSAATHSICAIDEAWSIMLNAPGSTLPAEYRQVAADYFLNNF
jgi:hypothetical protein